MTNIQENINYSEVKTIRHTPMIPGNSNRGVKIFEVIDINYNDNQVGVFWRDISDAISPNFPNWNLSFREHKILEEVASLEEGKIRSQEIITDLFKENENDNDKGR